MSQDLVDLTVEELEKMIDADYVVPDPLEKEFKSVLREIQQAIQMEIESDRELKMLEMRTEWWEEVLNRFGACTGQGAVDVSIDHEQGVFDIIPREDK